MRSGAHVSCAVPQLETLQIRISTEMVPRSDWLQAVQQAKDAQNTAADLQTEVQHQAAQQLAALPLSVIMSACALAAAAHGTRGTCDCDEDG